jgi:hypothetical protein
MSSKEKAIIQSSSSRSQKVTIDDLSFFEKLDTIPAFLTICKLILLETRASELILV